MAMYHFRIKSDKRQNGAVTNAVQHAKYINRQDEYANIDSKQELKAQKFGENFISYNLNSDAPCKEDMTLLYQSPYGSIIGNDNAVCVSDSPSPTTVDIALMYAYKQSDGVLNITGSDNFKEQAILCSADLNLNVTFADADMQSVFTDLKGDYLNGYEKSKYGGRFDDGTIKSDIETDGGEWKELQLDGFDPFGVFGELEEEYGEFEANDICESDIELFAQEASSTIVTSVHQMSGSIMDDEYAGSPLLLSNDEEPDIRDNEEGLFLPEDVRWENAGGEDDRETEEIENQKRVISPGRIKRAEKIAEDMLRITSADLVKGQEHVAYINREEQFASRGGCIYTAHHLPSWAADAKDFFMEADKNERINGSRYKEIEFALPNELNLEQQKEIIEKFISHHLNDFYYAYAVHEKIGALSDGKKHPHVHIMFSERKMDDYEKQFERPRGLFFKTASRIDPSTGGCKKDPKFNGRYRMRYLYEMRRDFADIQNEILEKYGFNVRVDHRTLKAQREAALERGDLHTAELLDRLPESSVGPITAQNPSDKKVVNLQEYRKLKEKISENAYLKDLLEDSRINANAFNTLLETDNAVNLLNNSKNIIIKTEYDFDNIMSIIKTRQNNLAKLYMSGLFGDEAIRMAMLKLMPSATAAKYDKMTELMDKKKNMQEFISSYPAPEASEDFAIYLQMYKSMKDQINETDKKLIKLAKELKPTFLQLANKSNKKAIQDDVTASLQQNKNIKIKITKATDEMAYYNKKLALIISDEKNRLAAKERYRLHTESYSSRELLTYVYNQKKIITNRMNTVRQKMYEMRSGVLSETAAHNIALSIYTKGKTKELNQERRFLEKEKTRLQYAANELKKLSANNETYKEKLSEYNTRLALFDSRTQAYKASKERIDALCKSPHAINRINQITANILQKNYLEKLHYNALSKEYSTLKEECEIYKNYMKSIRKQVNADAKIKMATGKMPKYSISPSAPVNGRANLAPQIIAGVLAHDERMAKLVAYVHTDAATARFLASGKTKEEMEAELDQAD